MKMKAIVFCFAILLPCNAWSSATDIYLAQTAQGAGNGTDCADAYAYTFFNTAGNWGSGAGQIGPGTTVHICGVWTGTAGQNFLVAKGSGTSGNPVTIKFETGAALEAPYFDTSAGAIFVPSLSYIVIDGGTNGLVEDTLNGTPGFTCPAGACLYQQSNQVIQMNPCDHCEVKNLTIGPIYEHQDCETLVSCDTTLALNQAVGVLGAGVAFTVDNDTIHDGAALIDIGGLSGNSFYIHDNNFYNFNIAINGGSSSGTTTAFYIYNNHFHGMDAWDAIFPNPPGGGPYHHNDIHLFSNPSLGQIVQSAYIYNNLMDGDWGNGCCVTAGIFLEGNANAWTDSTGTAYVWNNVIISNTPSANALISISNGTGHKVLNNTLIDTNPTGQLSCISFGSAPSTGATNVVIENNAIQGCQSVLFGDTNTTFTTIDYNAYGSTPASGNAIASFGSFASAHVTTLSAWQAECSCDLHSVASLSTTFAMAANGTPLAGFIGNGVGANLTSLGTGNLISLLSDTSAAGTHTPVARPSSGAWDMGAYQFVAALLLLSPTSIRLVSVR